MDHQVLCLSYDGRMFMSIACDDRVPEPERLGELYLDELRQLGEAYGVNMGGGTATTPASGAASGSKPRSNVELV